MWDISGRVVSSSEFQESFFATIRSEVTGPYTVTLAENGGMDIIDTVTELRSKQSSGKPWMGVDVKEMKIVDMRKKNIIEPLAVKEQIIKFATEATAMLLRIDDILASFGKTAGGGNPPGTA